MSTLLKKINYIKSIFKGIDLNVRSKIADEIEDMFLMNGDYKNIHKELTPDDYLISLKVLESALRDALKDLKIAKKDLRAGKISSNELIPYKLNVEELTQQIKDLKSRLNE